MRKIKIFDTTLRDGEQSPGCSMTIDEKIIYAKMLEELEIEFDVNRIDDYVTKIKEYLSENKTINDDKIKEIVSSFNKVKKR